LIFCNFFLLSSEVLFLCQKTSKSRCGTKLQNFSNFHFWLFRKRRFMRSRLVAKSAGSDQNWLSYSEKYENELRVCIPLVTECFWKTYNISVSFGGIFVILPPINLPFIVLCRSSNKTSWYFAFFLLSSEVLFLCQKTSKSRWGTKLQNFSNFHFGLPKEPFHEKSIGGKISRIWPKLTELQRKIWKWTQSVHTFSNWMFLENLQYLSQFLWDFRDFATNQFAFYCFVSFKQ